MRANEFTIPEAFSDLPGAKPPKGNVIPSMQQTPATQTQQQAAPKSSDMAKDIEAGLANKFGVVQTKGINTGVSQNGAAANTANGFGRNQVARLAPPNASPNAPGGSNAVVPAGPDIGTQSSTGGQTFQTPTGTKHFANPNNPNNTQAQGTQGTQQDLDRVKSLAGIAGQQNTAPSLGAPTAQQQAQPEPEQGATTQEPEASPSGGYKKPTGFLAGLAKGFKKGIGVDPEQGLATGLAGKALGGLGFNSAARTVTTRDPSKMPKPGTSIDLPGHGSVKVLPTSPGMKGVHLDTSKTLGHPIYVDPMDLDL
jgi:hypothetical protein